MTVSASTSAASHAESHSSFTSVSSGSRSASAAPTLVVCTIAANAASAAPLASDSRRDSARRGSDAPARATTAERRAEARAARAGRAEVGARSPAVEETANISRESRDDVDDRSGRRRDAARRAAWRRGAATRERRGAWSTNVGARVRVARGGGRRSWTPSTTRTSSTSDRIKRGGLQLASAPSDGLSGLAVTKRESDRSLEPERSSFESTTEIRQTKAKSRSRVVGSLT